MPPSVQACGEPQMQPEVWKKAPTWKSTPAHVVPSGQAPPQVGKPPASEQATEPSGTQPHDPPRSPVDVVPQCVPAGHVPPQSG